MGDALVQGQGRRRNDEPLHQIKGHDAIDHEVPKGFHSRRYGPAHVDDGFHGHDLAVEGKDHEVIAQGGHEGHADDADEQADDGAAIGFVAAVEFRREADEEGADNKVRQLPDPAGGCPPNEKGEDALHQLDGDPRHGTHGEAAD